MSTRLIEMHAAGRLHFFDDHALRYKRVFYDALVEDIEGVVRGMLEHVDAPFDE
jgi:hypothetical protein